MGIQITPSILNADFAGLGAEVARIGSADWVHVDVMDAHFAPNLTFGPRWWRRSRASTAVPLDAPQMIEDPDRQAPEYVEAGCGSVTFHVEAAKAPVRLAREIRRGCPGGMALKPATHDEPYEELLPELDMLLMMTVEPGFGGQKFLELCLPKIRTARQLMEKHGLEIWLQVDGGISLRRSSGASRPGRTCSSPARRSTPPAIPTGWSPSFARGGDSGASVASDPGARPGEAGLRGSALESEMVGTGLSWSRATTRQFRTSRREPGRHHMWAGSRRPPAGSLWQTRAQRVEIARVLWGR